MDVSLFNYDLPPDRIAQKPMEPREAAKLLVLDRVTGAIDDKHVSDLPNLLRAGDLLVFNDSKVFKARLRARSAEPGARNVEIFLLRPDMAGWKALVRPARTVRSGHRLTLIDAPRSALRVLQKHADGTLELDFGMTADEVFALCDRIGEVPVPPYVEPTSENTSIYQTAYAKHVGSVAAPTAGFHFTPDLLKRLADRGVQTAFVTLHVGLGTFRPMKTTTLEEHMMHEEWAHVPVETALAIRETKKRGGRVIVVGTTAMRALESAYRITHNANHGPVSEMLRATRYALRDWSGFTNLFITPGFRFKVADGLITNFHLPKSTLIVLVSAFAGPESIKNAYLHAIDHGYRFYSFGDAMLIS